MSRWQKKSGQYLSKRELGCLERFSAALAFPAACPREFQGIFLFGSVSTEFPIVLGILLDRRTSPDAALLQGMHITAAAQSTTAVAHLLPLPFYAALRIQRGQVLVNRAVTLRAASVSQAPTTKPPKALAQSPS